MSVNLNYDSYIFPHDSDYLDVENFKLMGQRKNKWKNLTFEARQSVTPISEFQGTEVLNQKYVSNIMKLNAPVETPSRIILLGASDVLALKPKHLILKISEWNKKYNCHVYLCNNTKIATKSHANLLARFDDPAYQKVFKGMFVCNCKDYISQYRVLDSIMDTYENIDIVFVVSKFGVSEETKNQINVDRIKFMLLDKTNDHDHESSTLDVHGISMKEVKMDELESYLDVQSLTDAKSIPVKAKSDTSNFLNDLGLGDASDKNELLESLQELIDLDTSKMEKFKNMFKDMQNNPNPDSNNIEKLQKMLHDVQHQRQSKLKRI